ncbi:early nodulin-75-like [Scaptodrosophila lebanonensis]|uniref:Early nodulin-75-like n=1 Tax=Drosophila lebanonensis TaxID=7225 RepID=A0A6J2U297_DROLE|nr:early nodulin-75-like [Scaptodrosophila lebanonensis]XP_030381262.1 early nodulin-75-like [Scaptodrosophila lebanonensis]
MFMKLVLLSQLLALSLAGDASVYSEEHTLDDSDMWNPHSTEKTTVLPEIAVVEQGTAKNPTDDLDSADDGLALTNNVKIAEETTMPEPTTTTTSTTTTTTTTTTTEKPPQKHEPHPHPHPHPYPHLHTPFTYPYPHLLNQPYPKPTPEVPESKSGDSTPTSAQPGYPPYPSVNPHFSPYPQPPNYFLHHHHRSPYFGRGFGPGLGFAPHFPGPHSHEDEDEADSKPSDKSDEESKPKMPELDSFPKISYGYPPVAIVPHRPFLPSYPSPPRAYGSPYGYGR